MKVLENESIVDVIENAQKMVDKLNKKKIKKEDSMTNLDKFKRKI